jgi:hypothetical protein
MRRNTRFKQYALLGIFTAALVSAACSDDDDDAPGGEAGKGGSSSGAAGSSSAGKPSDGGKAGSGTAGTATAGTTSGGSAGTGGAATAGTTSTAGTAPVAGAGGSDAGAGGEGGEAIGGESGAPAGGAAGEFGGGGEAGAAPIVYATLANPGFELGTTHMVPTGWTNEGTAGAAYFEAMGPHSGAAKLSHWSDWAVNQEYTARTFQTLEPIENGTYSFSIWVERTDVKTTQNLFAKGHDLANPDLEVTQDTVASKDPDGFVKITLSGIVVTSGKITVGVHTVNWGGNYVGFDDAELVKE